MWSLVRDGLEGLGLLTAMSFVLLIVFVVTSPRGRRRELVHCTLCDYANTVAKVMDHEKQDHAL